MQKLGNIALLFPLQTPPKVNMYRMPRSMRVIFSRKQLWAISVALDD